MLPTPQRPNAPIRRNRGAEPAAGPILGAPVLVVRVRAHGDGREIENAIIDAMPGRHVRLVVGSVPPPQWVRERIRADLRIQVEATNERILTAWLDALGGVE